MSDSKRFRLFAKEISNFIPKNYKIGDIAGGKGKLKTELKTLGYLSILSWDGRHLHEPKRISREAFFHGIQMLSSTPSLECTPMKPLTIL